MCVHEKNAKILFYSEHVFFNLLLMRFDCGLMTNTLYTQVKSSQCDILSGQWVRERENEWTSERLVFDNRMHLTQPHFFLLFQQKTVACYRGQKEGEWNAKSRVVKHARTHTQQISTHNKFIEILSNLQRKLSVCACARSLNHWIMILMLIWSIIIELIDSISQKLVDLSAIVQMEWREMKYTHRTQLP